MRQPPQLKILCPGFECAELGVILKIERSWPTCSSAAVAGELAKSVGEVKNWNRAIVYERPFVELACRRMSAD